MHEPRRRRGHDATSPEPLFPARIGDLLSGHASDGGLRRQGTEAQAHDHGLRRFRLRLRADGWLPADLRGSRRPHPQKAVAADRDARLHALSGADRGLRRRVPGICRIKPVALHEAIRRGGSEIPGRDRRNRRRRRAAALVRRRGGRPLQLLPLHARPRDRQQQALHCRDEQGLRRRPRLLLRRPLRQRHGHRRRLAEDRRQVRRQGRTDEGAQVGRAH